MQPLVSLCWGRGLGNLGIEAHFWSPAKESMGKPNWGAGLTHRHTHAHTQSPVALMGNHLCGW